MLGLQRAVVRYISEQRIVVCTQGLNLTYELCVAARRESGASTFPLQQGERGVQLSAAVDRTPSKQGLAKTGPDAGLGK